MDCSSTLNYVSVSCWECSKMRMVLLQQNLWHGMMLLKILILSNGERFFAKNRKIHNKNSKKTYQMWKIDGITELKDKKIYDVIYWHYNETTHYLSVKVWFFIHMPEHLNSFSAINLQQKSIFLEFELVQEAAKKIVKKALWYSLEMF